MTLMYGPAVRSKKILIELVVSGLASMYPTFDWSFVPTRPSSVFSARAISLADRPRSGH